MRTESEASRAGPTIADHRDDGDGDVFRIRIPRESGQAAVPGDVAERARVETRDHLHQHDIPPQARAPLPLVHGGPRRSRVR